MNVLPIGQARRRFPELVRKVSQGHPPVRIGRRGRVEAVLSAPPGPLQVKLRPLRGLVTLHGELDGADRELREMFHTSLLRTAAQVAGRSGKQTRKTRER